MYVLPGRWRSGSESPFTRSGFDIHVHVCNVSQMIIIGMELKVRNATDYALKLNVYIFGLSLQLWHMRCSHIR